jgi:hypothetical protein
MSIKLVRINNHNVGPVPQLVGGADTRPVKGGDIVAEPFANIAMIGKKESGKTSVIYKVLSPAKPHTYIYICTCGVWLATLIDPQAISRLFRLNL